MVGNLALSDYKEFDKSNSNIFALSEYNKLSHKEILQTVIPTKVGIHFILNVSVSRFSRRDSFGTRE